MVIGRKDKKLKDRRWERHKKSSNISDRIINALISTNLSVNKHGSSYKSFIFHFTGIKSGLMVVDHTFAMPYATPSEDNYSSEEELKEIINEQVRQ